MNVINIITPPLIGAFIGWITNVVAIKMLFRPLKPWRIFGIRVPMTPGVIPSKRRELAVNIGRMVGSQLLTPADISKALSEATFKRELETMIGSRLDDLLSRDLGPLPTIIPKRFRASFEAGVNILRLRTLKLVHGYLDSPEFSAGLGLAIATHVETFLARPLESWLPAEHREHLFSFANETMEQVISSPQAEAWLRGYLDQHLASAIRDGKSLNDLLPAEFSGIVLGLLEQEIPGLLARASQFAAEPAMRAKLVQTLCGAIHTFIGSLGPMAALASSFLSEELIETKVTDYLVSKGDDIALWLNNDLTRDKARAVLAEKTAAFLARPLGDLLAALPADAIDPLKEGIISQLLALLKSPQTGASLTAILRDALETQAGRPSEAILTDLFGEDGLNKGRQWTTAEVMAIIRSAKTKRILDTLLSSLVDKHLLGQPLGPLNKLLPKEVQSGICDYLLQQSHTLLIEEVPRLVEVVNIQRIVTRKVDSLDLLRLEGLLLSIMEEQFKYINLFGGLLGFIIGLMNLAFQH
jgi:uncharacterized membrane protein YheB (UPF0754 family)